MGYISLAKFTAGEVDLIPADNIVHIGMGTGPVLDEVVVTYGVGDATGGILTLTCQFAEAADGTTDMDWTSATVARNAFNNAIQITGETGRAAIVQLEPDMVVESVTPSWVT